VPEFFQLSLPRSALRRSRSDSGSVRSLRLETAWFTRYRPSLAIRRPSATIRQDRSLSQAPVATPAALPRYHLHRLLPPLTAVACTPLPRLRADRSRSF